MTTKEIDAVKPDQKYFEEFIADPIGSSWPKFLGSRILDGNPDNRILGYHGRRDFVLTEPITLNKGHKTVIVKASVKRPIAGHTTLQKLN